MRKATFAQRSLPSPTSSTVLDFLAPSVSPSLLRPAYSSTRYASCSSSAAAPPTAPTPKPRPAPGENSTAGAQRIKVAKQVKAYLRSQESSAGTASSNERNGTRGETPGAAGASQRPPRPPRPSPPPAAEAAHPRRKPLGIQPLSSASPRPSSKPLDILSRLRSSALPPPLSPSSLPNPPSPSPFFEPKTPSPLSQHKPSAVVSHNDALRNLTDRDADFATSFECGWRPIRLAQEVGRLKPPQLAHVLQLVADEMGKEGSEARWSEVKELVLWVAGEDNMPGLAAWSLGELKNGVEGAGRVVEVWEAVVGGEHKRLREGRDALDRAFRREELRSPREKEAKAPTQVFINYVVAKSVVHPTLLDPPLFSDVLPTLLSSPIVPALTTDSLLSRIKAVTASLPPSSHHATISRAQAWLRQVSLAQAWSHAGGQGIVVIRRVATAFRRHDLATPLFLWESIREGYDEPEVAWITDRWQQSRAEHRVDGASAFEDPEFEATSSPSSGAKANIERPVDDGDSFKMPKAYFTQALIAPFLTGFAFAREFDHAASIWQWLASRSPPLVPGVVAWTGLLNGYARRGNLEASQASFSQMVAAGVKPDLVAWVTYVDAFFVAKQPAEAMEVVKQMFADKDAKREFENGRCPPVVYRKIASGLLSVGRLDDAKSIMAQMEDEGVAIDIFTVNVFLRHYTSGQRPDFPAIVQLLQLIAAKGLEADVFTYTMILQSLLTTGQSDAPRKLIEIMEGTGVPPSLTTYGAIINNLARSGTAEKLTAAVELLDEMESHKLRTNEIMYTSVILGFLRATSSTPVPLGPNDVHPYFSAALALKSRMAKRGIPMNRIGYNALIATTLSSSTPGGPEYAMSFFRELQARYKGESGDVVGSDKRTVGAADTWYILLNGFAQRGDWANARGVVREMAKGGFRVKSANLRKIIDTVQRGGWAA